MLLHLPFLNLMIRVREYPFILCFLKKRPESYCELCVQEDSGNISRILKVRFKQTVRRALTKLKRVRSYMRLGTGREGIPGGDFFTQLTFLSSEPPHQCDRGWKI